MYNESLNNAFDALMVHDESRLLWLAVALVLGILLGSKAVYARKQASIAAAKVGESGKTTSRGEREAGGKCFMVIVWKASSFRLPPITPSTCTVDEIPPLPYRPFRAGPQHTTMGLKAMQWNDWIELDSLYEPYQRIRTQRIQARGPHLIRTLPARDGLMTSGSEAAWELLAELVEYLPSRYPQSFRVRRHNATDGPSEKGGKMGDMVEITVIPTGMTFNLDDPSLDPMEVAALLVQDDLVIMIEGSDGNYYFQAGAVLVPGFWRLEDKIGMALDDIHNSGNVPHYREKLQPSMTRFFRKLAVEKPVWRNNYFFQVIDEHQAGDLDPLELAWCEGMGGREDKSHPKREFPPAVKSSTIIYRTERQTLRRLPRTGAIVFTIRTYLVPLEEIVKEPGVPERLASAVRGMSEDTWKYKHGSLYGDVLLKYLDDHADKQGTGS